MEICDLNIHRVRVPRIYTTKVAPAGGHEDGKAVSLHVGVAGKGVTVASDLVGPGLLEGDVCVTPLGYTNGGLEVGRFRGLGLELSEEQLTHYRVE